MSSHLHPRILIIGVTVAAASLGTVTWRHGASTAPTVAVQTSTARPTATTSTLPALDSVGVTTPTVSVSRATPHAATPAPAPTTSTTVITTPAIPSGEVRYTRPNATLRSRRGTMTGNQSTSCWKVSPTTSLCACGPGWDDPETSVEAEPGEELTVSYDRTDHPRHGTWSIGDSYDGDDLAHGALDVEHPRVPMPTRPGTYWVHVDSWWPEGHIVHIFKVNVIGTHAANETGSILGRTDGDPAHTTLRLTSSDGRVLTMAPDSSNRFRFDGLQAGTYTVEATIQSYAPYTAPGEPDATPTRRTQARTIELTPGEIERSDFFTES